MRTVEVIKVQKSASRDPDIEIADSRDALVLERDFDMRRIGFDLSSPGNEDAVVLWSFWKLYSDPGGRCRAKMLSDVTDLSMVCSSSADIWLSCPGWLDLADGFVLRFRPSLFEPGSM